MTRTRRFALLGTVAGICLLLLALLYPWRGPRDAVQASPSAASQPDAVVAAARLVPGDGIIQIAASVDFGTGVVERLLVEEGADVKQGQPLAYLASHDSMAGALAQAEAQLRVARAESARARRGEPFAAIAAQSANVETLRIEREQADLNWRRAAQLYDRDFVSAAQRDERRLSAARAASAWTLAQRQRATALAAREDAERSADAGLAVAQAAVERARADLAQTVISAPSDGHVLRVVAHAGERIGPEGLLLMGDIRRSYALAEVFVGDLPLVRVGMHATVEGGPLRRPVEGAVERIGQIAGPRRVDGVDGLSQRGERVAEVWIRIPRRPDAAYDSITRAAIHLQPAATAR